MSIVSDLAGNLTNIQFWLGSSSLLYNVIGIMLYVIIVSILFSIFGYVVGWLERKIIARAQYRHGPTYVGMWGILQNLADLIKLLAKQDISLANADRFLFMASLPLLLALSVFIILILPYSPNLQATNFSFGLLIVFTVIAFMPILMFTAGFASGNKFAVISAQRSVLLLLSYEVPTLLVVASIALVSNSYNLSTIVSAQASTYNVIFLPVGFAVFFITQPKFSMLSILILNAVALTIMMNTAIISALSTSQKSGGTGPGPSHPPKKSMAIMMHPRNILA